MTVTVEEVRGALDNAEANGHTFEDVTDEEIASDMLVSTEQKQNICSIKETRRLIEDLM